MALLSTTLADELKALDLYDNEADAIAGWAAAYREYMKGATSNGVTIVPAALLPAETAMIGASTGLSETGATALKAGIVAFWAAIVPATAWPTTTLITPPALLSGLDVELGKVFLSNKEGELSKDASMDTIATEIHVSSLGGTATWPGSPPVAIAIL